MSVRPTVLIALFLLVAASPAVAGAAPRWASTQQIDDSGRVEIGVPEQAFVLAGNQRGDRLLAWRTRAGVMYSFSGRKRRFAKPRLIASPWSPTRYLQVALDEDGRAAMVWNAFDDTRRGEGSGDFGCCERLVGAIARPRGAPARARVLSPPGVDAEYPRLAVSPSGRTGVTWGEFATAHARFGSTRRGFGKTESVADGVAFGIVLRTGRPRIAFIEGFPQQYVEYTRRSAGAYTRGPAEPADAAARTIFGADARGGVVLARDHERQDFTGSLEVATRRPGGGSERRTLASHGDDKRGGYLPQLEVAPSGASVLAWTRDHSSTVSAAVRGPHGGFTRPRLVYTAPPPANPELPPLRLDDVAAAPRGTAAIAVVPEAAPDRPRVVLLTRRGGVRASHAFRSADAAQQIAVVADARGTAVAWATREDLFVSTARWVR